MSVVREVSCPRCGALCVFAPSNRYRPFCSDRCKNVDWSAWASESYRVQAPPPPEADDELDGATPSGPRLLN